MRILFVIISNLISLKFYSQDSTITAFVFVTTLNVQEEPSHTSRIVCTLLKDDQVKLLERTDQFETQVDGYDIWFKIRHDNFTGFVLRGTLSGPVVQFNSNDTFDILLDNYAVLNYNPNLNWYGVFSTARGDELREIKIEPLLKNVYEERYAISPFDNYEGKYLFAIGTKERLSASIIGAKSYLSEIWLNPLGNLDLILYDTINGFSNGHKLIPEGRSVKSKDAIYDSLVTYTLYYENKLKAEKIELYTPDIHFEDKVPKLIWYGDLDHDRLPEFLFLVNGDNRGYDIQFIKVRSLNGKLRAKKMFSKRPELMSSC